MLLRGLMSVKRMTKVVNRMSVSLPLFSKHEAALLLVPYPPWYWGFKISTFEPFCLTFPELILHSKILEGGTHYLLLFNCKCAVLH